MRRVDSTDRRPSKKVCLRKSRFRKYSTLLESEKNSLRKLALVGDYKRTLFDRRQYLDDSCAMNALKLLKSKYPGVGGFQSVLFAYKPEQRDKN